MSDPIDARDAALAILLDYGRRGTYLNVLLSTSLSGSSLDRRDRAFVTEIVRGTVRMLLTLDWALSSFSSREPGSLDPEVLWILRLSAYQVLFTQVPDYAAVDAGARLARRYRGAGAVSFVNGVLRALTRGKDELPWPDPAEDMARYLEVRYSHPRWIVDMWLSELGRGRTESLCAADNAPMPLSLRCNVRRAKRDELAAGLACQGLDVELSRLVPEGLLVKGSGSLAELEDFRRGLFAVQDQGSMVVGHAVAPEPGMNVIDVCAAPGGKANHLAELMDDTGRVLALDVNPVRLALVEEAAERLGNTIVEPRELDATLVRDNVDGLFDRVLVDAPCSGLGTLSRRPDVRWRKRAEDVERLAVLQGGILDAAARMVLPGGMLVYSTCTISLCENQGVVGTFLKAHPEFEPAGQGAIGPWSSESSIQLYPDEHGCDGTFVSRLRLAG
jgi:16S rRNA (cytosine967-C5)-methyltransferase